MANRLLRTLVLLLYALSVAAPALAVPPADKANAEELLRKGDQYVLDGKLNQARAAYERALAAGANLSTDYTRAQNLGMIYMNGTPRDFAKAAKWLDMAWKMRTSADDTRLALAQALSWSGKYDAALEHFRALVQKNPDTAEYVTGLANTLYWAGKQDEAFGAYQHYLERKPSNVAMRLEYARLLSYARKLPDATLQYQTALQADPNNPQAQVGLAKIASWQDDFKGALEQYDKILRRHPGLYDAVVGKAYTLYWMGKPEEARTLFEQALKRNPNDKEVRATLKELGGGESKEKPKAEVAKAQPAETTPEAKPETKPAPVEQAVLQPETFDTHQRPEARNAITVMMEQAEAAANASNYVEAVHLYHQVLEREPQNTKAMIQIARVLSWSRNFEESAKEYDQLLQVEPDNTEARLERARVLSWNQNYDASIEEYNRLLNEAAKTPPKPVEQPKPAVVQAPEVKPATPPKPVESAQVKPPEQPKPVEVTPAPVERPAPEVEEAPPAPVVDVAQTRLELARVLAWAKRYDESLAQFNQILPPEQKAEVKDKPVLIEKARVLSWARQYEEAIKTYDVALALDPADIEARLGKGQTLYWWGRLDQAASVLRPLMQVQALSPENKGTTAFTLAAVEHGRGKNTAALNLLDATAADNKDAKDLRRDIRQEMRPVLRFTFGWEDDREIDSPPTLPSTIRALRYGTSVAFNVTPDVRMTVVNNVTQSDTSNGLLAKYGRDVLSYELEAMADWRANSWLEMIVGAGEGGTGAGSSCDLQAVPLPCPTVDGPRTHQFVYDIHPIITKDGWRVDFAAGRHIADYTPLSITNNVMRQRFDLNVSYNYRDRVLVGAEYWHAQYSVDSPQLTPALATNEFSTASNGLAMYVTPTWYRGEHITIDGGVRYEQFQFDQSAVPMIQALGSGGFFAPAEYQRIAGTGDIVWQQSRMRLDVHGTFGPQRVTGFATFLLPPPEWGTTGSFGTELSLNFGRFHPFVAYDWFDTATAGAPGQIGGSYLSHSLVAGFTYRF